MVLPKKELIHVQLEWEKVIITIIIIMRISIYLLTTPTTTPIDSTHMGMRLNNYSYNYRFPKLFKHKKIVNYNIIEHGVHISGYPDMPRMQYHARATIR